MNPTRQLHELGQSLWLDNITRGLLDSGTLARYARDCSLTGLTSNPTIFEKAIGESDAYDAAIRRRAGAGESGEALFFQLALEDLRRAADLFRPAFEASGGLDGWASLEVSPLLADDRGGSIEAAARLHALAERPNLFIKIPGTPEGVGAIEESIFAGVPINVTLLFSRAQYVAAAEAYLRGIERRIDAGRAPKVASVASLFVSRWDVAVKDTIAPRLRNRLGIAVAQQTYRAYRELLASARWQRLAAAGAQPQRLLWASTGTKDPAAPDTLYIDALAAPDTINTMPEKTLLAFADHGRTDAGLANDGGDAGESVLADCRREGIDDAALAERLQREGAAAFSKSWHRLLERIDIKARQLTQAGA
jgi:transaldolase